jgi:uncharacterized NAD(P)/FAD-binding protein YdhS
LVKASGPVAVIGGGFSGSTLSIHLLEQGASVVLIERSGAFGPGLAYGTACPRHLLNVRSSRMSLRADDPEHFVRWLERESLPADPDGFARRADYGRYIRSCLDEAVARARPDQFAHEAAEAVAVAASAGGATVTLADGRRLRPAGGAGHGQSAAGRPAPVGARLPGRTLCRRSWAPGALDGVAPDQDVFLIGAGLTAVDVLLALESNGWRGRAAAVSRRGLLPRTHGSRASDRDGPPPEGALSKQLRAVRLEARRTPWTEVLDRMRPHHQRMWLQASQTERRRFLQHLRPWWDVHRHRMAPEIGAEVERWTAEGRLTTSSGRLVRVQNSGEGVLVIWRPRGGRSRVRSRAAFVVNCTGPQGDPSRVDSALMRTCWPAGPRASTPAPGTGHGREGRIIDANGRIQPRLSPWAR